MKKHVFGRKFKRDKNERTALFKGLMSSLVLYGRITTTEEKAKAIKGRVDKLVGVVKKHKEQSSQYLFQYLNPDSANKLIKDIVHFEGRQSGYTRIIRKGRRVKDNAFMVIMEWVDFDQIQNEKLKIKSEQKEKKIVEKKEVKSQKKEAVEKLVKPSKKAAKEKTSKKK